MIQCTSAVRYNKNIVYKIAPKKKQPYCTISNGCIPRLPLMYATQTLLFSAGIIASTTKLFEVMK